MEEEKKCHRMKFWQHGRFARCLWFGGWLFTMAFLKLVWWQCIVAIVIWPYYLGLHAR